MFIAPLEVDKQTIFAPKSSILERKKTESNHGWIHAYSIKHILINWQLLLQFFDYMKNKTFTYISQKSVYYNFLLQIHFVAHQ